MKPSLSKPGENKATIATKIKAKSENKPHLTSSCTVTAPTSTTLIPKLHPTITKNYLCLKKSKNEKQLRNLERATIRTAQHFELHNFFRTLFSPANTVMQDFCPIIRPSYFDFHSIVCVVGPASGGQPLKSDLKIDLKCV